MLRLFGKMLAFGLIGLVVTPIVVFLTVLIAAHLIDPGCAQPSAAGACGLGALAFGFYSAVPGLLIGIAVALWRYFRRSRAVAQS